MKAESKIALQAPSVFLSVTSTCLGNITFKGCLHLEAMQRQSG
jgi:hypothetical protein